MEIEEQELELVDDLDEEEPDLGGDSEDGGDELPPVVEEESDEESLEELLEGRASSTRRGTDESEDEDDIMALATERDEPAAQIDLPPSKLTPVKDHQEFVCNRCHLVKARVQLADEERGLCRDCV